MKKDFFFSLMQTRKFEHIWNTLNNPSLIKEYCIIHIYEYLQNILHLLSCYFYLHRLASPAYYYSCLSFDLPGVSKGSGTWLVAKSCHLQSLCQEFLRHRHGWNWRYQWCVWLNPFFNIDGFFYASIIVIDLIICITNIQTRN